MTSVYKHRVCAFVDILGFAQTVNSSGSDNALATSLREALLLVSQATPAWQSESFQASIQSRLDSEVPGDSAFIESAEIVSLHAKQNRGTVFSDSIVLSAQPTFIPIRTMIFKIAALAQKLARLGILIRGGICAGQLAHSENEVFGPALVDAYRIESEVSIYPRVVVHPSCLSLFNSAPEGPYNPVRLVDLLRRDFDDLMHVDFLSTHLVSAAIDRSELLKDIKRELAKNLDSVADLRVRAKLQWLQRYLDEASSERPAAQQAVEPD